MSFLSSPALCYCLDSETINMSQQLREASARWGLDSAGRTLGNEGRAVCLTTTVQRPNVTNENGDRPHVKHPAARDTYSNCGGRANHRPNQKQDNNPNEERGVSPSEARENKPPKET